jgi:hypothetical protein
MIDRKETGGELRKGVIGESLRLTGNLDETSVVALRALGC